MPVLVVGADTPLGVAVLDALRGRAGEIRAFVSDEVAAEHLRAEGVKTALGDVSDSSHVEGAAFGCHTAILVGESAVDDRERSFATGPGDVVAGWRSALRPAGVKRVLLLSHPGIEEAGDPRQWAFWEFTEIPTAGRSEADIAVEAARLDAVESLDGA